MPRRHRFFRNWSIGQKTMASHLLIACLSIVVATMLCYLFGHQYTRSSAIEELERQAEVIAAKESGYTSGDRASRGEIVGIYQQLTDCVLFFVNRDGEAVRMQRYIPHGSLLAQESAGMSDTQYSTIELLDAIDQQFVFRVLQGETVSAIRQFVFAGGMVIFAGAPITDASGAVRGGVILAQPVAIIRGVSRELAQLLIIAAGIAVILAVLLAMGQTRMLVRPVHRMIGVARRMADGDYVHRVEVASNDEIGMLGHTLNTLSQRLDKMIKSLRDERDRLEMVIAGIDEGLLALDADMHVVHCNMAFLSIMEIDSVEEIHRQQRDDVRCLMQLMRQAIATGERGKISLINPSGRAVLAEVTVAEDCAEGQVSAVCLLADISEAQRLEQLRKDYVANISHELRTPLTGIRGMIEPLLDGFVETEEERQSCYGVILNETARLEKLVGEMLDMSRLQDGRISVELEPMELPGILGAAIRNMEPHARETGITLALETDGTPLDCMGNENRIMQVLVILLDNALDFTPRGGRITVFARTESRRHVVVGVRDTGCGIEPRDLPLIWERFYKADRSRMRTKGTGLGLAIAKLVVELMGGEISVRSEPGKGSEFTFTLNRQQ